MWKARPLAAPGGQSQERLCSSCHHLEIAPEFCLAYQFVDLRILSSRGMQDMIGANRRLLPRRQKSCVQRNIPDVAAGNLQAREKAEVQIVFGGLRRKDLLPDAHPLFGIRKREIHQEAQPAQESLVKQGLHIGSQDGKTAIVFHPLQQIVHLDVGVSIMAVPHFTAFAEEGIRFVEEQDGAALLSCVKDLAQVLLRFAYVLADDLCKVDTVEV